jgi:MYXO-CTERM domain-containing protein
LPDYFIRYTGSDNFNGIIAGADLSVAITVVPAPGAAAFSMLALPALVRRRRR